MKKIKNMLKKGGIADIVTLMIIVGLVIALIVAIIIPMINDASERAKTNEEQMADIDDAVETIVSGDNLTINRAVTN